MENRTHSVINGYEHSLSYNVKHNRDYLILGTTCGSQVKPYFMVFVHIVLVRMAKEPVITHLKIGSILNKKEELPSHSALVR